MTVTARPFFQAQGHLGRPATWDDLQTIPSDSYRYEVLDGVLLASPAPGLAHQLAVTAMYDLLRQACPDELYVGLAPYDFTSGETTVLEPDLFVARLAELGEKRATRPPLLAVEVVSPSSHKVDRGSKRLAYEELGVASYWVVDPIQRSVLVLERAGSGLAERALLTGDDELEVQAPFPVRLSCALLDR